MRKLLAFALFAFGPLVFAQQAGETIEVRVANVDVVVTDRSGKAIQGLTKDDFELFENGKPQTITNFAEYRGESRLAATAVVEAGSPSEPPAPPPEVRQRSIVVFMDNTSIDPLRRNQAIDAITRALDALLRPGDDACVVAWNRHADILQQFTTDRAALKRALEGSRQIVGTVSTLPWQKNEAMSYARGTIAEVARGRKRAIDAYGESVSKARSYAELAIQTQRQLLGAMTQTISLLSGMEGKKILLFVGGELEQRPGLDLFMMIDSLFASLVRNTTPSVIRENDLNTTFDLVKVARSANASDVTMYMIDALDRGTRTAAATLEPDNEIEFTAQSNSYLSMALLASNTGGTVLSGSTNFALALDNVARDLDSYYSLGYKPPAGAADRKIAVKVKQSGAVVRAKRVYAPKTAEQQIEDRVVSNAFHVPPRGDFPVSIETSPPEPFDKGLFKVKLVLTFPSTLTYLPEGENLNGEYAVFFVTAAEDGTVSSVGKQIQPVKFLAKTRAAVNQKPFTHSTALIVKPGTMTLSVVVVDRLGARNGYAKATITAR